MKNIIGIFLVLAAGLVFSCKEEEREAVFEDTVKQTIYDYLKLNEENFSSFLAILESGNLTSTLSAYNPDNNGYTLFAPDNQAIEKLVNESQQFNSLQDIINDPAVAAAFARYHVVNMRVRSNDFPFGAFSEQTLSKDYLIVSFVIEEDTAFYMINNQAAISQTNIETSNGFIHHLETALEPVTQTTYQLLEQNPGVSIFKEAVELTGLHTSLDFNLKTDPTALAVTVLAEPDSVYQKRGIHSLDDLIARISPEHSDYTSEANPLYNYILYHFLSGNYYIDDFVNSNTNYNTFSEVPLYIDGRGLDIAINPGKENFDTLISEAGDTTIINFIKLLYDESNIVSQSGAIHFIDQVMTQKQPTRASVSFHFREQPVISNYYQEKGEFLIEENSLNRTTWEGVDLFYVAGEAESSNASNYDYLQLEGDFTITYRIPRLVQGRYRVILRAESFNATNAVVELYVDRKKVGGMIDLSVGSTPTSPFRNIEIGTIEFNRYEEHEVEVRSLIPGRFLWDYIQFTPY